MKYLLFATWLSAVPALAAEPAHLTAIIDTKLAAHWKKTNVTPAPIIDDATFLRRASLDLIGRIPTPAEVRAFLTDTAPNKRITLVHRLIDSGAFTRHMATFWRRTWVPQADTPEFAGVADDFEQWVAVRLAENTPYDRMAQELLIASDDGTRPFARRGGVSPAGFFIASQARPENIAANATRAFLGVNLDCAQCHDHPFARWTRDQFWQTAAFFVAPVPDDTGHLTVAKITLPGSMKSFTPELIDGTALAWPTPLTANTPRRLFADWTTSKANPYFARNAVNRIWAQLYGTALIEPLDDLSSEAANTSEHAELLHTLAEAFIASGYDVKFLTRALVQTRAYQLSAIVREGTPTDPRRFARMPMRGLTGEQLYDSLRTAAGLPAERNDSGRGQGLEARKRFAGQFRVDRTVSAERSIVQALALMNGKLTNELTTAAHNPTLAGMIDAPFLDDRARVELLFLAVLSRMPTEKESSSMMQYITATDAPRAFGDLFWALINSAEFNTNH